MRNQKEKGRACTSLARKRRALLCFLNTARSEHCHQGTVTEFVSLYSKEE